MSRTYSKQLACGCLIATTETYGHEGVIPCYAEHGDMRKKEDKQALELHDECWKKYLRKHK